jgi:hypothetical protein
MELADIKITPVSFDDFIGVFDTNYDPEEIIGWHKYTDACGYATTRGLYDDVSMQDICGVDGEANPRRDSGFSTDYFYELIRQKNPVEGYEKYRLAAHHTAPAIRLLNEVIGNCARMYIANFREAAKYTLHHDGFNLQKTVPGQGYHIWHCEDTGECMSRRLVSMMYLNEGFEGGETEWLYQARRETPKTGRVVIWPATFTHTHRGNPPLNGEKYIATSWFHHIPNIRLVV